MDRRGRVRAANLVGYDSSLRHVGISCRALILNMALVGALRRADLVAGSSLTDRAKVVGADSLHDQKTGPAAILAGDPMRRPRWHGTAFADTQQVVCSRGACFHRQRTFQQ